MSKIKKYVKLRDKGTIFHDGTSGLSVTGSLPTGVSTETPKIKKALKDGILVVVDTKKAEQEIADAKGKGEEHKATVKDATEKAIETATASLTAELETKDAKIKELESTPKGVAQKDFDAVQSELAATKEILADTKKALALATKTKK